MELDYKKITNVQVDQVNLNDHPKYTDAYIVSADYDGKPMNEKQIDSLSADFVHDKVIESLM